MEHLFSTKLSFQSRPVQYDVNFDREQYVFAPVESEKQSGSFSLKRQHDEWLEDGDISPEIKSQAVEALEKYLLKQH